MKDTPMTKRSEREKVKCSKLVGRSIVRSTCEWNAKVERDGRWYCGVHDPVSRAESRRERQAIRDAAWKARDEASDRVKAIQAAKDAVVEAAKWWRKSNFPNRISAEGRLAGAVDGLEALEKSK